MAGAIEERYALPRDVEEAIDGMQARPLEKLVHTIIVLLFRV
jgi:hypothetical protein